jgi:hypothetical protein
METSDVWIYTGSQEQKLHYSLQSWRRGSEPDTEVAHMPATAEGS